jgi:hypothetical protein
MISQSMVSKLAAYADSTYPVLSVYLGAEGVKSPSSEFFVQQFHSLLHKNLNKSERDRFVADIARIEEFLSDYKPQARTLVFFSAGKHLWEIVELGVVLPEVLNIDKAPLVEPLKKVLNEDVKYLVLLVDREKARMFTVSQDEIAEHEEFLSGFVPQKVRTTGRSINRGDTDIHDRYAENMLNHHIDLVAKNVARFIKPGDVSFVLVGGHAEMVNKVVKSLPKAFQDKVAATFVSELNIPLNDILLASKKVAATIK